MEALTTTLLVHQKPSQIDGRQWKRTYCSFPLVFQLSVLACSPAACGGQLNGAKWSGRAQVCGWPRWLGCARASVLVTILPLHFTPRHTCGAGSWLLTANIYAHKTIKAWSNCFNSELPEHLWPFTATEHLKHNQHPAGGFLTRWEEACLWWSPSQLHVMYVLKWWLTNVCAPVLTFDECRPVLLCWAEESISTF